MNKTPRTTKFSQTRLDRQLTGGARRAQLRVTVAAEMGRSPFDEQVVREAHRRARV
jgi:hypothetical protein